MTSCALSVCGHILDRVDGNRAEMDVYVQHIIDEKQLFICHVLPIGSGPMVLIFVIPISTSESRDIYRC